MVTNNLMVRAETSVWSSAVKVWSTLTDPKLIKHYMMGTTVESKWEKGSDITWKGEIIGKKFKDKGEILEMEPFTKIKYSHFSPSSGLEDKPENYHTVTIELETEKNNVKVRLTQDKNNSEKAQKESEMNWNAILNGLKKLIEK